MADKKERYFIPICEVTDAWGITHTIERFGNAWKYSLQCGTPTYGKWIKNKEVTKEEYFAS
jgi:hypothetical protein